MSRTYLVLGAGRQGVAAAYDLAMHGAADAIVIADISEPAATAAATRVNSLSGTELAHGVRLDVADITATTELMAAADVCLSAVPYPLNFGLTNRAIAAGTSFCDLGGNGDVVMSQLGLDPEAREAGVSIVPDCGVGPGMIGNLAMQLMAQFDSVEELRIYDGGLPQNPRPPFNYAMFFNVVGLTNEYAGNALYIRDGELTEVETFADDEYEIVDIPELGKLEAFVTSGGLTTLAHTCSGELRTLTQKTLRYPGHVALFKGIRDLGMLDTEPVAVNGSAVSPREFLHAMVAPRFAPRADDRDLVVIHMIARGIKDGADTEITLDLLDKHDEATGFAAMERTTGFHLAIVAAMMAAGEVPVGATALEHAVDPERMVEELHRRGMRPTLSVKQLV